MAILFQFAVRDARSHQDRRTAAADGYIDESRFYPVTLKLAHTSARWASPLRRRHRRPAAVTIRSSSATASLWESGVTSETPEPRAFNLLGIDGLCLLAFTWRRRL